MREVDYSTERQEDWKDLKVSRHLSCRNVENFQDSRALTLSHVSRGFTHTVDEAAKDAKCSRYECAQISRPDPGSGFRPTCNRLGGLASAGEKFILPMVVVGA